MRLEFNEIKMLSRNYTEQHSYQENMEQCYSLMSWHLKVWYKRTLLMFLYWLFDGLLTPRLLLQVLIYTGWTYLGAEKNILFYWIKIFLPTLYKVDSNKIKEALKSRLQTFLKRLDYNSSMIDSVNYCMYC